MEDGWLRIDDTTPRDGDPLRLLDPSCGEIVGSNASSAPIAWASSFDPFLGWPDDSKWFDADGSPIAPTHWKP